MKLSQRLALTVVVAMFGSVYANDGSSGMPSSSSENMKHEINALKSSFDKMSSVTARVATELARVEVAAVQTALKATRESLTSTLKNMHELVAPLVASQTVYKAEGGQNYIIPTASISVRQQFNIADFAAKNEDVIKGKSIASSSELPDAPTKHPTTDAKSTSG